MADETVTLKLGHEDAEVLLGVLLAERHNDVAQRVCDDVARQLEEQLNPAGPEGQGS
jgi:hypothetical protein